MRFHWSGHQTVSSLYWNPIRVPLGSAPLPEWFVSNLRYYIAYRKGFVTSFPMFIYTKYPPPGLCRKVYEPAWDLNPMQHWNSLSLIATLYYPCRLFSKGARCAYAVKSQAKKSSRGDIDTATTQYFSTYFSDRCPRPNVHILFKMRLSRPSLR